MILPQETQRTLLRKEVAGGSGELHGLYAIAPGEAPPSPTAFQMIGRMTLQPGCSIGLHTHVANEETYYILSGSGLYTDHDGSKRQLRAGDCTVTPRGEQHALENNMREPLVFLAIIAA